MSRELRYEVLRAFAHDDVYYTRANAEDIKALPRALRDDLIATGHIAEFGGDSPTDATLAAVEAGTLAEEDTRPRTPRTRTR